MYIGNVFFNFCFTDHSTISASLYIGNADWYYKQKLCEIKREIKNI